MQSKLEAVGVGGVMLATHIASSEQKIFACKKAFCRYHTTMMNI